MQVNRSNRSQNYVLAAPIGGLNVRDSLELMPETDAIAMDNYYPSETKVCLRSGYQAYALNKNEFKVETLIDFSHPENSKLFACGNGEIWDVTSSFNEVKESEGYVNNQWQFVQFRNRIIACNGYDEPIAYLCNAENEWVWEKAAFEGEGLQPRKLIGVCTSKQRLFFIETNSLNCWYSEGVGEVQGKFLKLDFSSMVSKGGHLQAIVSWTQDGGQGTDDLTVFITSEGEVLVYSGNNPSQADDWFLKGKYYISRPIGNRAALQYKGDVIIITEEGYMPLSLALPLNQAASSAIAYSDKIRGLVLDRIKNNKNHFGWQALMYPRGGYALFNVPNREQFEQHIINMSSGAWCRFVDIRAGCWGMFMGRLYFGSDKGVYLFDEGKSDDGKHIYGKVQQAFSALLSPNLKKIQMINPRTKSSSRYALSIYTLMDFEDTEFDYLENIGAAGITKWAAKNKVTKWSSLKNPVGTRWATLKGTVRSQWILNSAMGFKASIVFKTKTRGNIIEWYNTGFRYEEGSGIC